MFHPQFLIIFLLITCCKVIVSDFQDNKIDDEDSKNIYYVRFDESKSEKIWVLELTDGKVENLELREANNDDEQDFKFYTQPLIDAYNREHKVVKKDSPKTIVTNEGDKKKISAKTLATKDDIFKYLNKFSLYSNTESDGYVSDSHENDDPLIALYFKGGFASLIVKLGIRQWHYFLSPPTLLPDWFFESHDSERSVPVPLSVVEELYPALFRLLQAVLRYPLQAVL